MLRPTNARNTMTFLTITTFNREPVAIETTGVTVYGKSTAPFLSCLAKKLVDISGDPREWQWLHQRLSLAVVRGNTTSSIYWPVCNFDLILATPPEFINQCSCPSLAFLIAIAYRMPVFFMSFIVFSRFFYAFRKASVQYCFAPLFSHPD